MAKCIFCGADIPDGVALCPYCGRLQQPGAQGVNYNYAPPQPTQYDLYARQQERNAKKDLSTAKTLGIVSIVCAVICSFLIVGIVCGVIGLGKAKNAMAYAQQTADLIMYDEAKSARTLNRIGLIIATVIVVGAVVLGILATALGFAMFD
ncbi:MAG: zinc-ribbon domain-containing protein [Eubacterium sp.]|nr:zinc-ribbon domain-containing protein [Eubacterium sp.]